MAPPRHPPAAKAHDGGAIGSVGLRELKYVVEASTSQQGGLDSLGTIRGRQQDHAFHVTQVVDLTQKLAENPLIDVGTKLIGAEFRCDGVNGVEEKNAGCCPSRLLEDFAQRPFRFPQPLGIQLWAINGDERNLLLARERSCQGCLTGTRGSSQQYASGRRQSDLL